MLRLWKSCGTVGTLYNEPRACQGSPALSCCTRFLQPNLSSTLAGIGERLPRWRMGDQADATGATWLFRWSGPPPPPPIPKIRKPNKRRWDAGISTIWHVHIPEGLLPDSVDIGAIYGDVGENPTVRSLYQRLRDADPASSSAAAGADPTPDCGAHAEHPDAGMQSQAEGKRTAEPAWTGDEPAQTPSANDLSHSRGGCHHADAQHAHDRPCAIETAAPADAAASDPALSMVPCDPHERAASAPAGSGGEVGRHGCVRM